MKGNILCIFMLYSIISFGQSKLPILRATQNILSVKEGTFLHQNIWTISPNIQWDEFITNSFKTKSTVTFYSDIDSLSFSVEPNQEYDFIILLNNEQPAYTRISTSIDKKPSVPIKRTLSYYKKGASNSITDSIPFKIGEDNRIHIIGRINQSDSLDLVFDTGANAIVLTKSLINNSVHLNLDGQTQNEGSDGISTIATSSNNQLEIGALRWDHVDILAIDYEKPPFDGVLGWIAFEGKIVEINYEQEVLVIHPNIKSIKLNVEYEKYPMKMLQGVPYIQGTFIANKTEATGWLGFDTGCSSSILLSQKFAHEHKFNNVMPPISVSHYLGSAGVPYSANDYTLPKLKLGIFETYLIPISISQKDPEGVTNNDLLGNLLLKRFNTILDFKNHVIYLKPNKLLHSPYY